MLKEAQKCPAISNCPGESVPATGTACCQQLQPVTYGFLILRCGTMRKEALDLVQLAQRQVPDIDKAAGTYFVIVLSHAFLRR
eukprot:4806838-Pleurochrysis_carterae.AAC.1